MIHYWTPVQGLAWKSYVLSRFSHNIDLIVFNSLWVGFVEKRLLDWLGNPCIPIVFFTRVNKGLQMSPHPDYFFIVTFYTAISVKMQYT